MSSKVYDEITFAFPYVKDATVKVWEWVSNFILHFNGCNYLSILGWKLIHLSKRGPRYVHIFSMGWKHRLVANGLCNTGTWIQPYLCQKPKLLIFLLIFDRFLHGETMVLGRSALGQAAGLLKSLPKCYKAVMVRRNWSASAQSFGWLNVRLIWLILVLFLYILT